jgi:AraC-like DNA-binding protein
MLTVSNFSSHMPSNVSLLSIGHSPLHSHKYLQIIYVLDGAVDLTLSFSKYKLKKGDVFVVHYGDIHSLSGEKGKNHIILLDINLDYFKKEYPDIENRFFVSYLMQSCDVNNRCNEITNLIEEIVVHFANEMAGRVEKSIDLTRRCIDSFYTNFLGFALNKEDRTFESKISARPYQMHRISNVIATIYENYNTKLTLEEVASSLHIDKFYLSHLIKGLTGESFQNLLGMARVEYSEELLLATNMSIYEIALAVGFSNVSYYEKHFVKWYDMTPEAYRKKYTDFTVLNCKVDVIEFPVTLEILDTFEGYFKIVYESNLMEIFLDPIKRVGPEEMSSFHTGFEAYCKELKESERLYGPTPVLKTPLYYINYYYSRLLTTKSDSGQFYVASRSGKDFCLFFFNPIGAKDYEVSITQKDAIGKGRVLEYQVDPSNSVLNYWKQLGSPKRIDPEELRAIEASTHPRIKITTQVQEGIRKYTTLIHSGTSAFITFKQL